MDYTKYNYGTDKASGHEYMPVYESIFRSLRDQPVRILEIGVERGGSIHLWSDFFPHAAARILGLDVRLEQIQQRGVLDADERIHLYQGNATDKAQIETILEAHGPLDIVIDDGSHSGGEILASYTLLYPHLKPDGFYVIEDWPAYDALDAGLVKILKEWKGGSNETPDPGVMVLLKCANQGSGVCILRKDWRLVL